MDIEVGLKHHVNLAVGQQAIGVAIAAEMRDAVQRRRIALGSYGITSIHRAGSPAFSCLR